MGSSSTLACGVESCFDAGPGRFEGINLSAISPAESSICEHEMQTSSFQTAVETFYTFLIARMCAIVWLKFMFVGVGNNEQNTH